MPLLRCSLLLVAAFTASTLAVMSWRKRDLPCTRAFFFMMVGAALWAAGDGLRLIEMSGALEVVLGGMIHAAIGMVMVSWLALALEYTSYGRWITRKTLVAMFAIPALTVVGVVTNHLHHAIWTYTFTGGRVTKINQAGFHVFEIYCSVLMVAGVSILILSLLTASPLLRRQTTVLLAAGVLPWFADLGQRMGFVPPGDYSPVPYCFTVSGPLLAWGILRFRLLDIVPLARHHVLHEMEDGILVVDSNLVLLDINPTAERLLGLHGYKVLGQPVIPLLHTMPGLREWLAQPDAPASIELSRNVRDNPFILEVHRTPVEEPGTEAPAMLVFLRDVTADRREEIERNRLVTELQETVSNVQSLSGLLPICSGCRKVHGRDGAWQTIEEFLELHSKAALTHSICPDCLKRLYPDLDL